MGAGDFLQILLGAAGGGVGKISEMQDQAQKQAQNLAISAAKRKQDFQDSLLKGLALEQAKSRVKTGGMSFGDDLSGILNGDQDMVPYLLGGLFKKTPSGGGVARRPVFGTPAQSTPPKKLSF